MGQKSLQKKSYQIWKNTGWGPNISWTKFTDS